MTGSNATERQTWVVTLSNQYTMAQLEADVDALISAFDPTTVPSDTFTQLVYPADTGANAGITVAQLGLGVGGYASNLSQFGQPYALVKLQAAALSAYTFLANPNFPFPPGFAKVVGFLTMAGAYCLKTFTVDPSGNAIGSPTCVSGSGTCGTPFKVVPPAPHVPNLNTYVLVVPNCRCAVA